MQKRLKPLELFLKVGMVAALGSCSGPGDEPAKDDVNVGDFILSQESEGGEGGEYGESERANADFQDKLTGAALLGALKEGGHVIYFRHAQTERDYADQADPNMSLGDCDTQRKLSDIGIQQSKDIGAAFADKEIPVGAVITSDYCRAWQTADLAFGRHEKNSNLNFLPFEEYTDAQVEEMKANITPLLTAVPAEGQNTVIVGHDDLFEAATGIYPAPQGLAYVLTPDGNGKFELVANMLPEEWAGL